ncbi:hypothetical protein Patl1_26415 [Pistacia atlantica]|uniref:Uncharacterized protein n=1 Tax=Pistacia atlantica TaxID=434234 RepID=A0ACC1AZP8_9ROSI|nr:hypothetical protein Patl1_26415 [Pistacia atlantica]
MLAGILKENGVSGDGINFDQGARTALAFVTLRADGEREFMFYRNPSADMLLRPGRVEPGAHQIQFLCEKNLDFGLFERDDKLTGRFIDLCLRFSLWRARDGTVNGITVGPTRGMTNDDDDSKRSSAIKICLCDEQATSRAIDDGTMTRQVLESVAHLKLRSSIMGSISLIVEPCRSAHLKAMEVAKDAGALLSYDPNLRLPLWPSPEEAREQILSIWDKAEVIKVSDVELEFLTGSNKIDDESALSLWHPNLKLLLVTLGEHGCRYYTKAFKGSVEAFHVNTVDTTGAGDSYIGALLCKIVDDQSVLEDEARLREVLKFANACGAITTTKKGAIPALPTEADVLSLIKGA